MTASRRMGRAALVVSAGILVARILGYVRDAVLAGLLGASQSSDVYFAAFVIPDFTFYLMAGGYLAITFIPIFSQHLADDNIDEGWRAFAAIFRPVVLVMTVLTVIGMVFAHQLVELAFDWFPNLFGGDQAKFSDIELSQIADLTRIVLPAQIFFLAGSLLMGVQYAQQRFLVPTLAPIVYNLSIITGGVIAGTGAEIPAAGFAWGVLVGSILGNFALQWWGARAVGLRWISGVAWNHPALKEYILLAIPLMIGQSIVVLDEQLIRVFGQFGGEGGVAELGFARRLNMLPVGVIAQAAGVAAYPFLARLVAERKEAELQQALGRALRGVVFFSSLAAAGVVALSVPIVRVAFERFNFTAEATEATAAILLLFAISIPAWGLQQVLARAFYARRQMWTPVILGTVAAVIGLPLYVAGFNWLGTRGLALASTAVLTTYTLALAITWWIRSSDFDAAALLGTVVRSAVSAAAAGAASWLVVEGLFDTVTGFGSALAALLVGGLTLAAAFFGVARLLGAPELRLPRTRTSA